MYCIQLIKCTARETPLTMIYMKCNSILSILYEYNLFCIIIILAHILKTEQLYVALPSAHENALPNKNCLANENSSTHNSSKKYYDGPYLTFILIYYR